MLLFLLTLINVTIPNAFSVLALCVFFRGFKVTHDLSYLPSQRFSRNWFFVQHVEFLKIETFLRQCVRSKGGCGIGPRKHLLHKRWFTSMHLCKRRSKMRNRNKNPDNQPRRRTIIRNPSDAMID